MAQFPLVAPQQEGQDGLLSPPAPTQRIPVNPADFFLEPGFVLEPLVIGLNFPTAVSFSPDGRLFLAEAGFACGPGVAEERGRILELDLQAGQVRKVASGFRGPVTAATWHGGQLFVADGGFPGKIWRVDPDTGAQELLVDGLRSGADHFTGDLIFDPEGRMIFGVGSATNSAVVGFDNYLFGWLPNMPGFHDLPARNLQLRGVNFQSINPLQLGLNPVEFVTTGAFKPFGVPSLPGEVVAGNLLANGVIYRANADGTGLEVLADGLRNPFGLGFTLDGRLFVVDQGYDGRGSRPIANAPDPLWQVLPGQWYGWPDFVAGQPVNQAKFQPEFAPEPPQLLLMNPPPVAPGPAIQFPPHSASAKFDVSGNELFGFVGELFVAQIGTGAPVTTGGEPGPVAGFRIVRANVDTGEFHDFYVNLRPGPAGTGIERPVDCKFDFAGEALYVVDFGILGANLAGAIPWCQSGVLWRIRRDAA